MNMKKNMKDIPGYEGRYAITEDGRVWSYPKSAIGALHNGKFLKTAVTDGYKYVALSKDGKVKNWRTHRLVAITFIPNLENNLCINHKNGIRDDNRIENLEWCTHSENVRDGWDRGRKSVSDKKVMQLTKEGILCKIYDSVHQAGKTTGLHFQSISSCALGKLKTCGGYNWEYITIK